MLKILLILLALLGAALYFPSTRPVVLETAKPILDPVLRWNTRGEMNRILRDLEQSERSSRYLPAPGEQWEIFLRKEYQGGDATTDGWGSPYVYGLERTQFSLLSLGPDARRGTADDMRMIRQRLYPQR